MICKLSLLTVWLSGGLLDSSSVEANIPIPEMKEGCIFLNYLKDIPRYVAISP